MARATRRRWLLALCVGLAVICFTVETSVALRRGGHTVAGVAVVERGQLPDLMRRAAGSSAASAEPAQPAVPPAGTQVRVPRLGVMATVVTWLPRVR